MATETAPVVAREVWHACGVKYRTERVPPRVGWPISTGLGSTEARTSPKPIRAPASIRMCLEPHHEVAVRIEFRCRLRAVQPEGFRSHDHHRRCTVDEGDGNAVDNLLGGACWQQPAGFRADRLREGQVDRRRLSGDAIDGGVTLVAQCPAGCLDHRLDNRARVDVMNADRRLLAVDAERGQPRSRTGPPPKACCRNSARYRRTSPPPSPGRRGSRHPRLRASADR